MERQLCSSLTHAGTNIRQARGIPLKRGYVFTRQWPLLTAGSMGRRNTLAQTEAVDFLYMSQMGSRESASKQKPGVVSKLTARFQ
jgi:hypothetical protein